MGPFPVPRHMAESSECYDFVEACLMGYDALLAAGYPKTSLPAPIEKVKEAYSFIFLLLNGGNGFAKYEMDEGWTRSRVAAALRGMHELGLSEVAAILAPYVDALNRKPGLLGSRRRQLDRVFEAFSREDFTRVEKAWRGFAFNRAAHDYLRTELDCEILEADVYVARMQSLTACR